MQGQYLVLVSASTFFGALRWFILFCLIAASITLIIRARKIDRHLASTLVVLLTIISAPFLILTFVNREPETPTQPNSGEVTPQPEPTPTPKTDPKPEKSKDEDNKEDKKEEDQKSANNSSYYYPSSNQTNYITPSTKPSEAQTPSEDESSETPKYTIFVKNADILSPSNTTEFNDGTEVTIKASEKQGYTFDSWISNNPILNGNTNNPLAFQITSNTDIEPKYNANTNTSYTVVHKKAKLNGEYEIANTDNLIGTTDETVYPSTKSYTGFSSPEVSALTITGDGNAKLEYLYDRETYQIIVENPELIEEGDITDIYPYETPITVTAKTRTGYTFSGWASGESENPLTFNVTNTKTIKPNYEGNHYYIKYMKNGGFGYMPTDEFVYGETSNLITIRFTRDGYLFKNWNTKEDGSGITYEDGAEILNLATEGTVYLYAQWEKDVTQANISNPNIELEINENEAINITNASELGESLTFSSNDSTIATVDDNGIVTAISAGETTITITGNRSGNTKTVSVKVLPAFATITFDSQLGVSSNEQIRIGETLGDMIPGINQEHHIFDGWFDTPNGGNKATEDTVVTGDKTYYAIFRKTAYHLRIPTALEVERENTIAIELANEDEIGENLIFTTTNPNIATINDHQVTGVAAGTTTIIIRGAESNEEKRINLTVNSHVYTITFDAQNGEAATSKEYEEGQQLGTLPNVSYRNHLFKNWWTAAEGGKQINSTTTVNGTKTYYAHWLADISLATLSDDSIELTNGETAQLTVNTTEATENYTYASGDTSIITVDQNGNISTLKSGETTITVTGAESNKTLTASIKVNARKYTVTFDYKDETGETDSIEKEEGSKFDTLPTRERDGYTFAGWWTEEEGGEEFTTDTEITSTITLYAHWEAEAPKLVCKAAEELHAEPCTTGGSCNGLTSSNIKGATISDGIITYGTIPNSKAPKPGYAYDCDVNNDGDYNSETERFYYLNGENGFARLIYYTGFDGENGPSIKPSVVYSEARDLLPTAEQWSNPKLETYTDGKIARFPMYDDIDTACTVGSNRNPKNCAYIMESSVFSQAKNDNIGPRSGIWMHIRYGDDNNASNDEYWRIHTGDLKFEKKTASSTNSARPVITVREEELERPDPINHTVSFNTLGGNDIAPIEKELSEEITLPNAEKIGYQLTGWSATEDGQNIVGVAGGSYVITSDITLYAVWQQRTSVAYVEGDGEDGYTTSLQKAINKVPTTGEPKTIYLLEDTSETITVSAGQKINFILNRHTISKDGQVIANNGDITLTNGVIRNTATEVEKGAIDNKGANSKLYIIDSTVETVAPRQAVYNNGGYLEISGDSTLSSTTSARATVHNLNNGTVIIKSAIITSTGGYAVYNEKGSLTIGEKDGIVDGESVVITGNTYGVLLNSVNNATFNFYDGVIKGNTNALGKATNTGNPPSVEIEPDHSRIVDIEDNSQIKDGTQGTYKTIYLDQQSIKIQINFDANGGIASETSRKIEPDTALGTLPTATRSHYEFTGWFTDPENGAQVNESTAPSATTTYYAHWQSLSSDNIETFYTPSQAAKNYFQNSSTWNQGSTNSFLASMKSNYEANDCMNVSILDVSTDFSYPYNSGTQYCDRPTAYDTGLSENLVVRISDENTKTKTGNIASYVSSANGKITNMIPGTTYYWESPTDSGIYGYIKATGEHRFIQLSTTRNVRDLGGLTTTSGKTIKYGYLIRGESLKDSQDVAILKQLGMTKEYDLRGDGGRDRNQLDNIAVAETIHYDFDTDMPDNLRKTHSSLKQIMSDVAYNDEKIYFHCSHGADRTGTIAYLIEALLGVDESDRITDYELTTLAGQSDRTRYYTKKASGGTGFNANRKFVYMQSFVKTNQQVYDWFINNSIAGEEDENIQLVIDFQNKVLE